jgi:hypothetical protein
MGGFLVFAGHGGGQQNPDQAETGQGKQGDHEDRHRDPPLVELSAERMRCSVIAITDLRDIRAFPIFREECFASRLLGFGREKTC